MKGKGFILDDRSIECPPLSPRLLKILKEGQKELQRKKKAREKNEKNNKQNDGSKGS